MLRVSRLCSLALFAVISAGPLSAAEPWEAGPFVADPAELLRAASAVETASGEEGVIVLFADARYEYDEQGRATRVRRMVYRIVGTSADSDWSEISDHWSPWYQERPELKARVVTPDGTVHLLDPATFAESATHQEPEMFEDGRILRAPLPAIGPGAVVETEETSRDKAPFFDRGTVEMLPVRMLVPVRHIRIAVEAPAALPLRHVARALPAEGTREEILDGRRRLTFEYRDIAAFGEDDFELGIPSDVPWLAYVGFSTAPSWSEVAKRYSEIVEEAIRKSDSDEALRSFLRAANVPGKTTRETLDRILQRMGSEVRYTGIELGEGSIVPRTPAETLRRKFGDCKDKAVLLTALLRKLDIPAHVALLRAGEHLPEVEESLPGMGSFNHAIVVVPGEPAIWIDPTDRYARAGELPAGDQGRLALIASPTADGLVRTPEARAADNREVETREVFLADLGPARIVETSELRGVAERELRASYAGQDSKAVRELLGDYVSAVYLTEKIGKIDHSDPADLSSPFHLRIEAEESPRGYTDLPNASVALFPASTLSRLPAELQNEGDETKPRKAEYALTRPHISEIRYRIVPPAGFRPQALPSARVRQLGPGTLSEEYAADENGTVTATLRFEIDKRRLSAEEFEALRKGAVEVNEEDAVLLHFDQVGEAHVAAGRIREALDELRPLAAASPKKALPRLHIARALLAGGMGESAREEAKRAVDLEPSLAAAWRELAWILVHDPVGRLFGEGFDRAGALAAYRKAKELDPKDMLARRNLAILLEHDEKGRRYSAGADLAAAIDEYRAFKADLDSGEMDDNLAIDLLRTGRFQELKDLLDDLEATDLRKSLRLVALAALQGAGTAVKEAERSFPNAEERRQALEGAAGNLAIVRRYAEAADLLESASRRAPNAAEILMRAEMMRKTRRHDELNFSSAEPAGVAKRLLVLPAAGSLDPQVLLASFSRGVREEIGDEEKALDDFEEALASVAGMVDDGEAPVDMVLDLALSAVRETVAGNEALGFRVTLSLAFADEQMVYYVVREDGEYKLAGFYKAVFLLGREALLRLERGDLAGARQWLDWAREEWTASGGDDPLGSSPFTTLWTRGAEGTADEARCAAASLLAGSRKSETILPILLSCRDSAAEGPRRTAVDLSLALAYQSTKRYAEMADVAQRLSASAPGSQRAFVLLKSALARLERWDDVRRLAEQRLAAMPDDPDALQVLYETAEERGDLEEAEKHLQRIVDSGKATATGFNNLAWLALFRNKAGDQAVELAQRAAMLDEYGSPYSLHTLASLYAEMGKTAEAYRVILQALEASGRGGPDADDWYVFGRLAEHYGLPDAARSYYARVAPPEPGRLSYISTWRLAQQRLAVLGPEAKEAKRPRRR